MKRVMLGLWLLWALLPLSAQAVDPYLPDPSFHAVVDIQVNSQVVVLQEGGYALAGQSYDPARDGWEAKIIALDEAGDQRWSLSSEGQSACYTSLAQLADGSFAALLENWADVDSPASLVRIHVQEEVRAQAQPVDTIAESLPTLLYAAREGFCLQVAVNKRRDRHGGTFHEAGLEYHDLAGGMRWRHVFDQHEVMVEGVLETADAVYAYGHLEEQDTGRRGSRGMVARLDPQNGRMLWLYQSPDAQDRYYLGLTELPDGSLLAAGYQVGQEGELRRQEPVLTCLSPGGTLLWERTRQDGGLGTVYQQAPLLLPQGLLVVRVPWRPSISPPRNPPGLCCWTGRGRTFSFSRPPPPSSKPGKAGHSCTNGTGRAIPCISIG